MSSISPEETNRFQVVNRDRLLVDTNMSKGGSLSSTIKNPNTYVKDQWLNDIYSFGWQMMNREHIDATSDSTLYHSNRPTAAQTGHAIIFNSYNKNAFIQTRIPSSERDNYNIIIKGDGLNQNCRDIFYVDSTGEYIAIKPKEILTDTSISFVLSYIAFVNRTTGNIDHLFECEENVATSYIYDAVEPNLAFFTINGTTASAPSTSNLRKLALTKEWIKNPDTDLINSVSTTKWNYIEGTNKVTSFPITFHFKVKCDWMKLPNTALNYIFTNNNSTAAGGAPSGIVVRMDRYSFGDTVKYVRFFLQFFDSSYNRSDKAIDIPVPADGEYDVIITSTGVDASTKKLDAVFYVNGTKYVPTYSTTSLATTNEFRLSSKYRLLTNNSSVNAVSNASTPLGSTADNDNPINISKFDVFNFIITDENSPYTLEDAQSGKDIPSELILNTGEKKCLISLRNICYLTSPNNYPYSWMDQTVNNADGLIISPTNATYRSYASAPNKRYGTWCNGVGYQLSNTQQSLNGLISVSNLYSPRKVINYKDPYYVFELNSNMTFKQYWTWEKGTGTIGYEFEEDGTLVCKVLEDLTIVNSWSFPFLYTKDSNLIGFRSQRAKVTWDYKYINPDIFLIGSTTQEWGILSGTTIGFSNINNVSENGSYLCYISTTSSGETPGIRFGVNGRSVDAKLHTYTAGTILWKVRGLKVQFIPDNYNI